MFLDMFFHRNLVLGVSVLMNFKSGGLHIREKEPWTMLGAPGGNPEPLRHALGRLGLHFGRHFSIKNRYTYNLILI